MPYESGSLAPNEVRRLFDRIAPVYDVMNRVMTAGLDRSWRRLAVQAVVQPGDRVLDACCGTGDLAIAAEREGGYVTGLGFSPAMLERARRKSDTIEWIEGDMLALPFDDGAFDAATVGFGVRNVVDLEKGIAELRRVLRPAGRLAILEITSRAASCGRSSRCGSTGSCRSSGGCSPAAGRTPTCPRAFAASPAPRNSGAARAARVRAGALPADGRDDRRAAHRRRDRGGRR